ncbi:hypothetical protein Tco_1084010 [Tanacetum coccineum]
MIRIKRMTCARKSKNEHMRKKLIKNIIIMAQQLHATDVHPDEMCPPNKRCDLMDANKKVDLEHVQCPPESKILTNIIKNHSLRFSIAASSSSIFDPISTIYKDHHQSLYDYLS